MFTQATSQIYVARDDPIEPSDIQHQAIPALNKRTSSSVFAMTHEKENFLLRASGWSKGTKRRASLLQLCAELTIFDSF